MPLFGWSQSQASGPFALRRVMLLDDMVDAVLRLVYASLDGAQMMMALVGGWVDCRAAAGLELFGWSSVGKAQGVERRVI